MHCVHGCASVRFAPNAKNNIYDTLIAAAVFFVLFAIESVHCWEYTYSVWCVSMRVDRICSSANFSRFMAQFLCGE